MTLVSDQSAIDEALRLDECVLEQIHLPGAIQPHGALLTVEREDFTILQASSNCGEILGIGVDELLGTPLVELVGPGPVDQFRDILSWEGFGANPVAVDIGERSFDAVFHDSNGVGVVEFEPRDPAGQYHSATTIYAAIHRLSRAGTVDDLLEWSAREIRHLTKFDQVMVYRFHSDEHGEVVAESCAPGIQPFLGLHFPASDIPIQARRLYLKKTSRVIVSTDTVDAKLVPPENPLTGEPIDLSRAELRGISPSHIQFMKNMGQSSTISFSLVQNSELIGMITCANVSVKHIPYELRQGYEMLARQIALQWGAMEQIDQLTRRESIRQLRQGLIEQLNGAEDFGESLAAGELTIAGLIQADAAAVRIDGQTFVVGESDEAARIGLFFERLDALRQRFFESEALAMDRPDLADVLTAFAGVVVVPFGIPGNYLAWFRRERAFAVDWLGDQSPENRLTPLSPRNSFATWTESVSGRSLPWDDLELVEAAEFGRDLDTAILNRPVG
ncbi:MAG: GAF domain-containing protein [Pseudolysinimonas sp.]